MAGAVDGDFRAAGLDGRGGVSCFLEGVEAVWRGGDEVWAVNVVRSGRGWMDGAEDGRVSGRFTAYS